jgi:hypothetical protein
MYRNSRAVCHSVCCMCCCCLPACMSSAWRWPPSPARPLPLLRPAAPSPARPPAFHLMFSCLPFPGPLLPVCLPARLPACPRACLSACLPTRLLACLPAGQIFRYLDVGSSGRVDYVSWVSRISVLDTTEMAGRCRSRGPFAGELGVRVWGCAGGLPLAGALCRRVAARVWVCVLPVPGCT